MWAAVIRSWFFLSFSSCPEAHVTTNQTTPAEVRAKQREHQFPNASCEEPVVLDEGRGVRVTMPEIEEALRIFATSLVVLS